MQYRTALGDRNFIPNIKELQQSGLMKIILALLLSLGVSCAVAPAHAGDVEDVARAYNGLGFQLLAHGGMDGGGLTAICMAQPLTAVAEIMEGAGRHLYDDNAVDEDSTPFRVDLIFPPAMSEPSICFFGERRPKIRGRLRTRARLSFSGSLKSRPEINVSGFGSEPPPNSFFQMLIVQASILRGKMPSIKILRAWVLGEEESRNQNSSGKMSLNRIFSLFITVSNLLSVRWCSPRSIRKSVWCERPVFLANWAYDSSPRAFRRYFANCTSKLCLIPKLWQNIHNVCVMI